MSAVATDILAALPLAACPANGPAIAHNQRLCVPSSVAHSLPPRSSGQRQMPALLAREIRAE